MFSQPFSASFALTFAAAAAASVFPLIRCSRNRRPADPIPDAGLAALDDGCPDPGCLGSGCRADSQLTC